jgi:SAM-dependent methyltransferase
MKNRDLERFRVAIIPLKDNYKTVLDVGCRDKVLKSFLKDDVEYQGIDYQDGEEVLGHNLENGIPFPDNSFDVVFALDVLEHVDNIQFLYQEIIRVAKKEAIVALPNMSYWKFRLRYLKGKDISDKYTLHVSKVLDRHRWLVSYDSALKLIEGNSGDNQVVVSKGFYQYKGGLLRAIDKFLSGRFPNVFVYTVFFHITKE